MQRTGPSFLSDSETVRKYVVLAAGLAILAVLAIALDSQKQAFVSSEVRFADASQRSGLAIVPASCPSSPHYSGQCSGGTCGNGICDAGETFLTCPDDCTPDGGDAGDGEGDGDGSCPTLYFCYGDDLYLQNYDDNQCGYDFVQTCPFGCLNGACEGPPSIEFAPFTATTPWSTSFDATGHLEARPILIRQGETAQLYWQAENVQSCTVTGSNGDSWDESFSGETGITSSVIIEQTIFTLNCSSIEGAEPPSVQESVIINVLPEFQET